MKSLFPSEGPNDLLHFVLWFVGSVGADGPAVDAGVGGDGVVPEVVVFDGAERFEVGPDVVDAFPASVEFVSDIPYDLLSILTPKFLPNFPNLT